MPVTHNSCRSSVYDILLEFENLLVIVTGRKRILSVTHEIVPDSALPICKMLNKIIKSAKIVIYRENLVGGADNTFCSRGGVGC